ncbi:hypothetical protein PR048_023747 [Dryococelus australis]|uniref:Uncharacterized protein n=1 Tax=Dryococelus australis TaxID=614101 RepID=A0ABQ9GUX4_9NEOP|nr:hypothetical protein PR048_023747 [Dryococelus australis]
MDAQRYCDEILYGLTLCFNYIASDATEHTLAAVLLGRRLRDPADLQWSRNLGSCRSAVVSGPRVMQSCSGLEP